MRARQSSYPRFDQLDTSKALVALVHTISRTLAVRPDAIAVTATFADVMRASSVTSSVKRIKRIKRKPRRNNYTSGLLEVRKETEMIGMMRTGAVISPNLPTTVLATS